jgi:hypothetical protein
LAASKADWPSQEESKNPLKEERGEAAPLNQSNLIQEMRQVIRNGVEAAGVAVVLDGLEVLDGFRDFGAGDFFRIFQNAGAINHVGEFIENGWIVLEE